MTLRLVRLLILLLDRDGRRAHSSVIVPPAAATRLVLRIIHGMRRALLRRHGESRLVERLRLPAFVLARRFLLVQLKILGRAVEEARTRRRLIRCHVNVLLTLIHGA